MVRGRSLAGVRNRPIDDNSWCYLPYGVASGVVQMGRDRWLWEEHAAGRVPSVLRFYGWSEPTISLGFHQKSWPDRWNELRWRGRPVPLVRRPTGGRAVLHQGGLTYAVVTSTVGTNRAIAYETLCRWLIDGFSSLGVSLNFGTMKVRRDNRKNPNCFGLSTGADLCLPDGTKVIGSAQVWRDRTVLQHGTVLLNPDPDLFELVFGMPAPRSDFAPWRRLEQEFRAEGGRDRLCEILKGAAQRQWSGPWEDGQGDPSDPSMPNLLLGQVSGGGSDGDGFVGRP